MHAAMPFQHATAFPPRLFWLLPLLCLLSACGGGGGRYAARTSYGTGSMSYPEPGPPGDPWRPYIEQASDRFSVPRQWIRAVMHQESGGHEYRNGEPITSGAGAMGLMQLMPATYAELEGQYDLGSDPFEPHDNIMAGTAYISQMYRKYGAPAFLAAYNAGPQRLDDYLSQGRRLPNETVDYVAAIAPNLGTEIAMSGPLAAYASGGSGAYGQDGGGGASVRLAAYQVPLRHSRYRGRRAASCWHDPDAAYDPDAPCRAAPVVAQAGMPMPSAVAYAPTAPVAVVSCVRDPDAAFDSPCGASRPVPVNTTPVGSALAYVRLPAPAGCVADPDAAFDAPCRPARAAAPAYARATYAQPAYAPPVSEQPVHGFRMAATRPAVMLASAAMPSRPAGMGTTGAWAIQVGAFVSVDQARFATTMARQADFRLLAGSQSVVQQTSPFGHGVLYRARLAGLARDDAGSACAALRQRSIACMVVTPGG